MAVRKVRVLCQDASTSSVSLGPVSLRTRLVALVLACAGAAGGLVPRAEASDDRKVFLQWFETRWSTIEYRMPDFFMSGYDATWLPPPFKAADPTSAGFDTFDRFDLGSPGSETAYGTLEGMRAMIQEFHQSSSEVYVDLVMNHNSGRNNSNDFFNAGGYPGFVLRFNSDFWGDFHDGSQQSFDPGASNYNLFNGDLVGLIDIAQDKNYVLVRQPIPRTDYAPGRAPAEADIPAGTFRNRPDSRNRQFYPDVDNLSTRRQFVNPATGATITMHDINPADRTQTLSSTMTGDPVAENATAYLLRSTQWLLDVMEIDGFRLDAAKHIPQWFWNNFWDNSVFQRRRDFAGNRVTPFSFGEIVDSNSFTQSYTRKDGFGFRDALDLNGAGQLRDILNARGFGTWQNVLSSPLDTVDDGFNNGTLGVNHIFSHDNGSTGNGGSAPPLPGPDRFALPGHAFLLFRPGPALLYHHSREFISRYQFRGFWPREGNPTALGAYGSAINTDLTRLVQLANGYARGDFIPLNSTDPVNQSTADVLVWERRRAGGGQANVVVAVNDSYTLSNNMELRSVQTSFPAGTILRELTGNATDATIDPVNQIPDTITVPASGRITLTVPYNVNRSGFEHHKGYVIYGPAVPSGSLSIVQADNFVNAANGAGTPLPVVIAADPPTTPSYRRRLATIPVVTQPQFELRLVTTKTIASDSAFDDFAAFRIDGGFPSAGSAADFNGNGALDFSNSDPFIPRFESFASQIPLHTNQSRTFGLYRQTIDTSSLSEGYHYIKAVSFRNRPSGTDPLYADFRQVVYVDRSGPSVSLLDIAGVGAQPVNQPIWTFRVRANDRTANRVHILLNPPVGTDPLTLTNAQNRANQWDRFEFRRTIGGLRSGSNSVTVVAYEITGNTSVQTFTINVTVGSGDVNADGSVNLDDLYALQNILSTVPPPAYSAAADIDLNSTVDINDLRALEAVLRPSELRNMAQPSR